MSERKFPFLNRVVVSGLVARKPSVRTNKSGVATLKLSLTVAMPTLSDDSTRKQVSTIRISVFIVGRLAVSCESLLNTGSEIVVEGRLSSPPAHGSVSRLEVHAERIQLIDDNGAIQFLTRDFVEHTAGHDTKQDATSETVSAASSGSASDVAVVASEKTVSVRQKRSTSKPAVSKQAAPVDDSSSVVGEAKREPRPARPRRKRPARSAETVSEGKPTTRRRSSPKAAASATSKDVADKATVSVSGVDKSTGATVERKPATSRRRSTKPTSSRRAERRPRGAVKDSDKVKVQGKSKQTRDNDESKDSKAKRPSKPSSDSPFELVETNDSFDPFLLED